MRKSPLFFAFSLLSIFIASEAHADQLCPIKGTSEYCSINAFIGSERRIDPDANTCRKFVRASYTGACVNGAVEGRILINRPDAGPSIILADASLGMVKFPYLTYYSWGAAIDRKYIVDGKVQIESYGCINFGSWDKSSTDIDCKLASDIFGSNVFTKDFLKQVFVKNGAKFPTPQQVVITKGSPSAEATALDFNKQQISGGNAMPNAASPIKMALTKTMSTSQINEIVAAASVSTLAQKSTVQKAPLPTSSMLGCGPEVQKSLDSTAAYCEKFTGGRGDCSATIENERKDNENYPDYLAKETMSFSENLSRERSGTMNDRKRVYICVLEKVVAQPSLSKDIRNFYSKNAESSVASDADAISARAEAARNAAISALDAAPSALEKSGQDSMANHSGRKTVLSDHMALANHCIALDPNNKLYGGFKNLCDKKVTYGYCAYHPKKDSWADAPFFNCEQDLATKNPGVGALSMGPMGLDTEHTNGAERIYWFACTNGAQPEELHWNGSNIEGKCVHRD